MLGGVRKRAMHGVQSVGASGGGERRAERRVDGRGVLCGRSRGVAREYVVVCSDAHAHGELVPPPSSYVSMYLGIRV